MKLKKIRGDEETILKHKIKAREKNCVTNKNPTLDIKSQCRIPILWIETKQAKNTKPLKNTRASDALSLHKNWAE